MTIKEYFKQNNLNKKDFHFEQIHIINGGIQNNVDISGYAKPTFNLQQMYEIFWGLIKKLDVSKYANLKYTARQMSQIRKNLLNQKNKVYEYLISQNYTKEDFNSDQIDQICEGLEEGLDVSKYTNPKYTAREMYLIYKDLLKQQSKEQNDNRRVLF